MSFMIKEEVAFVSDEFWKEIVLPIITEDAYIESLLSQLYFGVSWTDEEIYSYKAFLMILEVSNRSDPQNKNPDSN